MIPPDVVNSLRTLVTDQQTAALAPKNQPVAAVQRIADVLSNLVPGQRILAEIQAMLPNGTYRATVAQRDITLALPFAAKPGDSLELEVTESEGKLTLAFVANRGEANQSKGQVPSAATTLSNTGKLIGDLMQEINGEGKKAPAAPLNGNQALVSTMPKDAAQLAPILKQALSQSGMFYEAHQARWVAGKLPTEQLRQEPQGRHSTPQQPLQTSQQATQSQTVRSGNNDNAPPGQALVQQMAKTEAKQTAFLAGKLPNEPLHQEQQAKQVASQSPQGTQPGAQQPAPQAGTNAIPPTGQAYINFTAQGQTPPPQAAAPTPFQASNALLQPGVAATPQQTGTATTLPAAAQYQPSPQEGLVYNLQQLRNSANQPQNSAVLLTQANSLLTQSPLGTITPPPTPATVQPQPAATTQPPPASPTISRSESSPAQIGTTTNTLAQPAPKEPEARNTLPPGMSATQGTDKAINQPQGTGIPRDIAPLVQQQLDGLANQNFAWQGQVWPGQKMWWEIGENPEDRNLVGEEADARWHTRLKLILPNLGGVDARLHLQAGGELGIRIVSSSPVTESRLREGLPALHEQLEAAGLNVRQILIDHEPNIET